VGWFVIIFAFGTVALGAGLIALARWARRRNASKHEAAPRFFRSRAARFLFSAPPIRSTEDLYFGTLPKAYAVFGRILIIVALVGFLLIIAIAVYAILRSN
jgi:hypothetical protein